MSAPRFLFGFRANSCGLFLLFLLVPTIMSAAVDFADPGRSKEIRGIIKDYSKSWQLYESMAPKTLAGLVGEYVLLRDEDSLTVNVDTLWFRNAGSEIVARYVVEGESRQRFALIKNRGRGLKITLDAAVEAPVPPAESPVTTAVDAQVDAAFEPESVPEPAVVSEAEPEVASEVEPEAVPEAEVAIEAEPETGPEPEVAAEVEPEAEAERIDYAMPNSTPLPEPQTAASDRSSSVDDRDSSAAELSRLRTSERLLRQELSDLRNRITLQAGLQDSVERQHRRIDSLTEDNKVLDAMNWEAAEKVRVLMAEQVEAERLRTVNDSLFFRIKQLENLSRQEINTDSLLAEMNALRENNERAQRRLYIIGKLQQERDSLTQLTGDLQATLRRRNLGATTNAAADRDSLVHIISQARRESNSLRDSLANRERLLQSLSARLERTADQQPDPAMTRAVDSLQERGRILENRLLAREARMEDMQRELNILRDSVNTSAHASAATPDAVQNELNAGKARIAELQAHVDELRNRAESVPSQRGRDESADSLAKIVETLSRANSRLRADLDQADARRNQAETSRLDLRDTLAALRRESVAVVTDLSTRLDSMGILLVSQVSTIKQLNDSLETRRTTERQSPGQSKTAAAENSVPVAVYESVVAHLQQARSTAAALEINLKLADANVGRLSEENGELRATLQQRETAIAGLKQRGDSLAALTRQSEVEGVIRPEDAALMTSLINRADSLESSLLMAEDLQEQAEVRSEALFRQMLDERERATSLVKSFDSLQVWAADTLAQIDARQSRSVAELNDLRGRVEQLRAAARADADVEQSMAWVVVGTERELRERGLIEGRGANLRLVEPLDPANFNIARRDARIIELADKPFPAERLQLLTHPQAQYGVSYHPTGDATATLLTIDKPEVFWRTSEFLVVLLR